MYKKCLNFLSIVLLATFVLVGVARAGLTPVLEYSFPDSYDGTTTIITDLSTAGNDATANATDCYAADVRPPDFTTGGSLYGPNGCAMTDNVNLVTNELIEAHGGYTIDTWFKEEQFIDGQRGYIVTIAGTEGLLHYTNNKLGVLMHVDNGSGGFYASYIWGSILETDVWYHSVIEFDTAGNSIDENGCLTGTLTWTLNDTVVDSVERTRHWIGDTLNNPIGINALGSIAYPLAGPFNGWQYDPKVYLGTDLLMADANHNRPEHGR